MGSVGRAPFTMKSKVSTPEIYHIADSCLVSISRFPLSAMMSIGLRQKESRCSSNLLASLRKCLDSSICSD